MPTVRDVVVDPALSNVSIKYTNEQFIADRIMPTLNVRKQNGKYYVYDKSNLRIDETLRSSGSGANEVDYSLSRDTYSCDDHALKEFVEDEVQDQADAALNPLVDATEHLTEKLMLDREKSLADLMADTGNITNNDTLSGTDQWSDYDNSDPIGDVRTARISVHSNIFKRPNTLALSKEVYDVLIDHPDITDRIKYSQLGVATPELLARIFQVDQVLIGEAGYNTATEGASDSLGYVWGKHAWVIYISPRVSLKTVTFGWTFTYKQRMVKRWRDEDREGTYVRVGQDNYDQKIVAEEAAYFIKDAVA